VASSFDTEQLCGQATLAEANLVRQGSEAGFAMVRFAGACQ
jgi:hypothetical protein